MYMREDCESTNSNTTLASHKKIFIPAALLYSVHVLKDLVDTPTKRGNISQYSCEGKLFRRK